MSNSHLFLKSGFPRAGFALGIGRYVCQLQRVTLKFCKSHGDSRGLRDYIEHDLVNFAKDNPGVVVYLKPRRHKGPVICAEYLNGDKQWIPLRKFTRDDIIKWMELLRTQKADGTALRLRKLWHTEFPSIQGPWTPWTFNEPSQNVAVFPNSKLGMASQTEKTATEKLIEIFQAQHLAVNSSKEEDIQKQECQV